MEKIIIVENITEFSIKQITESGQAFRWEMETDGSYTGVALGKVINIKQEKNKLIVSGTDEEEFNLIWREYFDLNRNYKIIIEEFKNKDIHLDAAVSYGDGIRILNQDLWEMIISFIISGNNNIPRIRKSIELISENYGDFILEKNGKKYYSFPTPEQLSKASIEDLRGLGVGYRDKYIFETTKSIVSNEVVLDSLSELSIDEGKKELKKLMGIGDKVAYCVLLFACKQSSAFPVDTWVKKILTKFYDFDKTNTKEINKFALDYFGVNCGIAQQYLFYYIRNNNIEL